MVVLIALLVIGVPLSLGLFVGVAVVVALPAVAGLRRRSAWTGLRVREGLRGLDLEGRIVAGVVVGVALLALAGLLTAGVRPLTEFDAWQLWTRKAVMLFYEPHLPVEMLTSRIAYANVNPDYPMLLPLLEAVQFRAGGRPDTQEAHTTTWYSFVAGVWAFAWLASRTSRPYVLGGSVTAGLAAPLAPQAITAYADVPVALFLGVGTLAMGLWLQDGRRSDLALASIGARRHGIAEENEGLVGAVIVFAVAVAVCLVARRRSDGLLAAGAAVATAVVAILPWRLWMTSHGVEGMISASEGLDPSYLADRFDRVWPSVQALVSQIVGQPMAQVMGGRGHPCRRPQRPPRARAGRLLPRRGRPVLPVAGVGLLDQPARPAVPHLDAVHSRHHPARAHRGRRSRAPRAATVPYHP